MSLNKARKRLIKKYHRMFNSHPIDIKISTAGEFGFRNFEITISQGISKEELNKLKGVLR